MKYHKSDSIQSFDEVESITIIPSLRLQMGKSPKEDSNLLADKQQGLDDDLHLLTPRMSTSYHTASLFTFKAIPQMINHL